MSSKCNLAIEKLNEAKKGCNTVFEKFSKPIENGIWLQNGIRLPSGISVEGKTWVRQHKDRFNRYLDDALSLVRLVEKEDENCPISLCYVHAAVLMVDGVRLINQTLVPVIEAYEDKEPDKAAMMRVHETLNNISDKMCERVRRPRDFY
jgi:hypothetical protein